MNKSMVEIKLSYIPGLREVVVDEIHDHPGFCITRENPDSVFIDFVDDLQQVKQLRSIDRAYVVVRDARYHPSYIANHKSIVGNLVKVVLAEDKNLFKSFKIICAGQASPEVRRIASYIHETYGLSEKDNADMKIHIIRPEDTWEVGVQLTPRPLSVRSYRVKDMSGAMDPTVAYTMNYLCGLKNAESYLNVFSGSGTLLIEAGQCYENLKQLIGFDNNKKHLSLAIQNIKQADLIERIQLKEKDILEKPELGKFDVITSDVPFGMVISKDEDLENLYTCFVEYCEGALKPQGKLAIYTSEHEILQKVLLKSKFEVVKTIPLKVFTSANSYLHPQIFLCKFRTTDTYLVSQ